jgi:hypothetical protein
MAKKKTLYRTLIQVEVLSEEPIPEDMTLDQIEEECNTGSFSGVHDYIVRNKKVKGIEAVTLVLKQGSSPDFFQMDENGNDLKEQEEE